MAAAPATKPTAPPFNPNRPPKQRFRENAQWVGQHRQMVDSDPFTRAIDMALLQYQANITTTINDGNGAGAVGLKLQGAQEFINVLRNLSEEPTPLARRPDDNLTHK